jgi:Gpi18-like mannosyltransferase
MTSSQGNHSSLRHHLPDGVTLGWTVALFLFLMALGSEGYGGDLECWNSWMAQLQVGGYRTVEANYPPLLLHWLWVGASVVDGVSKGIVPLEIIKAWTVFPVWVSWMALIYQVAYALDRSGIQPRTSWIFWLTVCNPAIIIDGPQWGQLDLLPWIPISCGLIAHQRGRHMVGPIFFVIAVATKFQAIVYAPVFAGLYLRALAANRRLLWAIPLSLLAIVVAFLPCMLVGRGWEQAANAYWNNIGGQPATSNNAANLWKLLGLGDAASSTPLWGDGGLAWITLQAVGLTLFAMCAGLTFVNSLRQEKNVWGLAVAINFCFFAFCPEMHERYLFGAVPAAAMWAAQDRKGAGWYLAATVLTTLNIAFIFFPHNQYEWSGLSMIVVAAALLLVLHMAGLRLQCGLGRRVNSYPRVVMACVSVAPLMVLAIQHHINRGSDLSRMAVGESVHLTDADPTSASQEFEIPRFQRRYQRRQFAFNDAPISSGIKVHAWSDLRFQLPKGRFELLGRCGPDKVAHNNSSMLFKLLVGGELRWQSEATRGISSSIPFSVSVQGPAEVSLVVDPLGSNFGDHGLWGDLILRRIE